MSVSIRQRTSAINLSASKWPLLNRARPAVFDRLLTRLTEIQLPTGGQQVSRWTGKT